MTTTCTTANVTTRESRISKFNQEQIRKTTATTQRQVLVQEHKESIFGNYNYGVNKRSGSTLSLKNHGSLLVNRTSSKKETIHKEGTSFGVNYVLKEESLLVTSPLVVLLQRVLLLLSAISILVLILSSVLSRITNWPVFLASVGHNPAEVLGYTLTTSTTSITSSLSFFTVVSAFATTPLHSHPFNNKYHHRFVPSIISSQENKCFRTMSSLTTPTKNDATTGTPQRGGSSSRTVNIHSAMRGGGRAPGNEDKIIQEQQWEPTPTKDSEARLIVIQITDVYTLENFASFKTLLEETKRTLGDENGDGKHGTKVICMLTGDFLSPYLLSSIDQGSGMMKALNAIPMDYLTWGNHEADIKHRVVCQHVRNFKGKWLNSNMLNHDAMDCQDEYDVIDITSKDGTNHRKIGLCAVLSDDPKLYEHFAPPGAFGGATITDPWDAIDKYKTMLEGPPYNCDLIVPLEHLYVHDDYKSCERFDVPVILSGHDHHKVDEVHCNTRLLKPGMNGLYATILEISWMDNNVEKDKPKIRARFVKVDEWDADPILEEECLRAYDALEPLRNTELARIPSTFFPLSSNGSRERVCTMGQYICTLIRSSLNVTRRQRRHRVDAVLLMGGNIRGNSDYPDGSYFSLEALEAEIKSDEVIGIVQMPGWVLAQGIQATHAGEPIPGWMQYDIGIIEDRSVSPPVITHVANEPIDNNRIYRVATKVGDLTNGQSPPLTKYFKEHPEALPPKGAYVNVHAELMSYFARNLWRKLWDATTEKIDPNVIGTNEEAISRLNVLNKSHTGTVTLDEIQLALDELLGYNVDRREQTLAEFVYSFADTTGDGKIHIEDFNIHVIEMTELYERDKWRLQFGRTSTMQIQQALSQDNNETSTVIVTPGDNIVMPSPLEATNERQTTI